MEDGEDLNLVPAHAIWDDIGGLDDDEFARSRYPSQPAKVWMIAQRPDRRSDAGNETSRGARIIARDIVADRLDIGQPAESSVASTLGRIFLDYPGDIVVVSEFAAIRGRDSRLDLRDLPCVEGDIVFDRLDGEPAAGALGLLGEPIQRLQGRLAQSQGKGDGHRSPFWFD